MVGKIYIIKNDVNDKVYIGATIQSLHNRFLQHCKKYAVEKQKCVFHSAIQKIGKTHFWIELLEDNVPKEKLFEREIFFIKKFNSFYNGYNRTKGGNEQWICEKEIVEKLIEEYEKGKSAAYLAKVFKVNRMTIVRTLKKHGINVRVFGRKIPEDKESVFIKMWNDKRFTKEEIGKVFEIDAATVRRNARRLNLPKRYPHFCPRKHS